jgi:hypothetical protein
MIDHEGGTNRMIGKDSVIYDHAFSKSDLTKKVPSINDFCLSNLTPYLMEACEI